MFLLFHTLSSQQQEKKTTIMRIDDPLKQLAIREGWLLD